MVTKAEIYIEGTGNKSHKTALRRAFNTLFQNYGWTPAIITSIACGPRGDAMKRFKIAIGTGNVAHSFLLVDSEITVENAEKPLTHLALSDNWIDLNSVTSDDCIFLMTTCTETWLFADHENLRKYYPRSFKVNLMPALESLESKDKRALEDTLDVLEKSSNKKYTKGSKTFDILASAKPALLREHLPSFDRMIRILSEKLQ